MRVVIADDSPLVREGIASLLRRAGFDVVAEAESGEELMPAVDAHEPELALVDVRMPPTYTEEGLRAAHEIRARHPRIGVVILSQNVEVGVAMRLLAETPAGLGYLLKDRAQQRLVSLAIALRMTEDRIHDDPAMAAGLVAAARKEVSESLAELRELARGIHPAVLEHGLEVALESLATRSRTPVTLAVDLDERLPGPIELAAYFVACEGIANVGKYAEASRATIRVSRGDAVAVIEISDDGIGGAVGALGSGLRGLADRVEALGGRLGVASPRGGGTVLTAELPCRVGAASRTLKTP